MEVTVRHWTPDTVPLATLSELFIEFYKGKPWNEYMRCPNCQDTTDFGANHAYGIDEVAERQLEVCPDCGTLLELYWSPERTEYYLYRLNNDGEIVFIDGKPAGWWRGRKLDDETMYLDVIALLPEFRLSPYREAVINGFKTSIAAYHISSGINRMVSRTHRKATHVRLFLRAFGFTEDKPSEQDPDRSYWTCNV